MAPDRDEPSKAFQRSGLVVDGALGARGEGGRREGAVRPAAITPFGKDMVGAELAGAVVGLAVGAEIEGVEIPGRAAVNMAACVKPTPSRSPGAARSSKHSRINWRDNG